jgi:hypothetical protein
MSERPAVKRGGPKLVLTTRRGSYVEAKLIGTHFRFNIGHYNIFRGVTGPTNVSRDFPLYSNGGKPDLTVDPQRFVSQMEIVDRFFPDYSCELAEGVVGGPEYRRLLRFDTVIMKSGDGDLIVGNRSDPDNPYASYVRGRRVDVDLTLPFLFSHVVC